MGILADIFEFEWIILKFFQDENSRIMRFWTLIMYRKWYSQLDHHLRRQKAKNFSQINQRRGEKLKISFNFWSQISLNFFKYSIFKHF